MLAHENLDESYPDLLASGFSQLNESQIVYTRKPPKQIRQYILGELLGKGSYAKVKEGVDVNSWKRVAIKIVNKRHVRRVTHGEECIQQEIEIHQTLEHKNCVRMIESFMNDDNGKLYIVLEYMGGGALQDLIQPEQVISLAQAREFFLDLVHGLKYLFSVNVLHRDIKPGNVMIGLDGTLKISDFGCAEYLDTYDGKNAKSQGSPAFQPPEVASGSPIYCGTKVDIWATGVTLYFLLTGTYPFKGTTVFNLFENITKGEYEIPDFVDEDAANLVRCMLHPDAKERATIEDILNHKFITKTIEDSKEKRLSISPQATIFQDEGDGTVAPVRLSEEGKTGSFIDDDGSLSPRSEGNSKGKKDGKDDGRAGKGCCLIS